jgi:hypothetical protein
MGGRERLALVAVVVLPVVPLIAALARAWQVVSEPGMDPGLVPARWPVPLFSRVGLGLVVALMCTGPAWRWVAISPGAVVRALPTFFAVVASVALVQALVAP